jgi:hypothetical protein
MSGLRVGYDVRVRFPVYAVLTDRAPSKHACRLTSSGELAEVVRVHDRQTYVVRFVAGGYAPVHTSAIEEIP